MKDTVKVNSKALFKVLDYLYKDEKSDYLGLVPEDGSLSGRHAASWEHIFLYINRLVQDAKIDPDDFGKFGNKKDNYSLPEWMQ